MIINMNIAGGKVLDKYAEMFGIKRKRYFLFIKESDNKLRERLREAIV